MAALQCEICGGKLIGKPGGVFECDSCGMEYSTEWAKAKVQEIKGTVKIEGPVEVTGTVKVEGGASVESLLKRGWMELESKQWDKAQKCFDDVLDIDPENGEAYAGKLCASQKCSERAKLAAVSPFGQDRNYQRAVSFGSGSLKAELEGYLAQAKALDEEKRRQRAETEAEARRQEEEKRRRAIAALAEVRKRLAPAAGLIGSGNYHTVGLKADSTVVAVGSNIGGQCDVSGWTDIVAVAAGNHTVGLKADGAVVAVGDNENGQCDVSGWTDIVAVAAGYYHTVGLKADGTVVATEYTGDRKFYYGQCDVSDWTDIVAVAARYSQTVGLKADGTVVAVGSNIGGQCDVSGWTDIMAVTAGYTQTVGLKSDGAVVATGYNGFGECDASGRRDIVAVTAGEDHTVGLKADGTVVAVGSNRCGQCNVSGWTDIVAVAAGSWHTVGLKADGTVVAVGDNKNGQCDVSGWRLFNSFENLEQERIEAMAKAKAERQTKIDALNAEKQSLQAELANLKGLFSGGKRRELEARLAQIEKELNAL